MPLLELAAMACLGAVLSTIPIGPMNLVLMTFTVSHRRRPWWAMTAGIVVMDATVAIATWVLAHMTRTADLAVLNDGHPYRDIVSSFVLAVVLMASGGMTLYRSHPGAAAAKVPSGLGMAPCRYPIAAFLMAFGAGALGTLLEPALPLFWGAWWLRFFHHATPLSVATATILGLSVALGDMLVFGAYRLAASSMADNVPKALLPRMEKIVGSILVLLATILCLHVFHKICVEAFS